MLHILVLHCLKTLSQKETHKPTIRATISTSISPSVAAPLPLCRHICPPARGRWANGFVVFSSKRRSVCFCLCLRASVLSLSVFSILTQPTPFSPIAQLATALTFSSPPPASRFPLRVFPSLSLFSAGNLKLSSLFSAPTLYHSSSLHDFSQSRIPL